MGLSVELLEEVELETLRFLKKLKEAKVRLKLDKFARYGVKETGAVKRSALDLKNELTRITQNTTRHG